MSSPNVPEACHGSLRQRALENAQRRPLPPPPDENEPPRSATAPQRSGRAAIISKHPGMAAGVQPQPPRALSSNVPGPRLATASTQDGGSAATASKQAEAARARTLHSHSTLLNHDGAWARAVTR